MTLEEAKQLAPGDVISGGGDSRRVITKVWIEGDSLCWNQHERGDLKHTWDISKMILVQKAPTTIVNTYPIF